VKRNAPFFCMPMNFLKLTFPWPSTLYDSNNPSSTPSPLRHQYAPLLSSEAHFSKHRSGIFRPSCFGNRFVRGFLPDLDPFSAIILYRSSDRVFFGVFFFFFCSLGVFVLGFFFFFFFGVGHRFFFLGVFFFVGPSSASTSVFLMHIRALPNHFSRLSGACFSQYPFLIHSSADLPLFHDILSIEV